MQTALSQLTLHKIAVFCAVGLGGLGALVCLAHRTRLTSLAGVLLRVQALTLGAGWLFYAFTRGFVFDRYLVVWSVAVPIAWLLLLPRSLLVLQTVVLMIVSAAMVHSWLL